MSNKQKKAYLIFGEFLFFSWKYGPVCGCCSMCINQENFFLNINESINSRDSENCSAGLTPTLSVWTQFWEPFHSVFSHERSSFYFPSSLPSLWNHNLNKISSPISVDSAVPLLCSRSQNEMDTVTLHVNVWQNPLQCCEVISLQLIKINEKKKGILRCIKYILVKCLRLNSETPGHNWDPFGLWKPEAAKLLPMIW